MGAKRNWGRGKILAALVAALCAMLALFFGSWAPGAYVRVNQMGYGLGQPMRAYFMTSKAQPGAKFSIENMDGKTAVSGEIGSRLGAWSGYTVYALDFTLSTPGTYSIKVMGPSGAASPSFRVGASPQLYSGALSDALAFYQNQRDGAHYIPSALRAAPAHLNDNSAKIYKTPSFTERESIQGDLSPTGAVMDASGGWADAGDYLKFVETTSYAEAVMLIGTRDFPNQMGGGSATSNFMDEAKFGLDWLQRMWNDQSRTLYYQVGIGSGNSNFQNDHGIWRMPQVDDAYGGTDPKYRYIRNRPVLLAGPAGSRISPNLAGRLAADFALCYRVYRASDAAYANQCLLAAEHIFDLADTSPRDELLTAAPHGFYGESEWRDDMELGATELYFAIRGGGLPQGLPHNGAIFYLQAAANWASAYLHSPSKTHDTLNLYDISGLAHFELCRALALAHNPGGLGVSQADLINDMRKKLEQAAAQAGKDPFGYGVAWQIGDTPSHGAGLAVMASEYDYLTNSETYAHHSTQWLANILGANAWGASFIVGEGSVFPKCIHHQVANLQGSHDGQAPILAGAMVEGPEPESATDFLSPFLDWLIVKWPGLNSVRGMQACPADGKDAFRKFHGNGAKFKDSVWSYSTAEPALDLTAPSMLLFSWRIAGAPSGTP